MTFSRESKRRKSHVFKPEEGSAVQSSDVTQAGLEDLT